MKFGVSSFRIDKVMAIVVLFGLVWFGFYDFLCVRAWVLSIFTTFQNLGHLPSKMTEL